MSARHRVHSHRAPSRPGPGRRGALAVLTGLLAAAGTGCIVVALTHQQHPAPAPLSAAPVALTPSVPSGRKSVKAPARSAAPPLVIDIPAIDVHSTLLNLGLARDGSLEVPPAGPDFDKAGWYRYSPTPGSLGPAVITGHVDSTASGPSVFFKLGALSPRDRVLIQRADGTQAVFAVDEVRRYHKTGFPSQLVYGDTDHAALRLITCGGAFDHGSGHYLDNVVVLASLIGSHTTARPQPAA